MILIDTAALIIVGSAGKNIYVFTGQTVIIVLKIDTAAEVKGTAKTDSTVLEIGLSGFLHIDSAALVLVCNCFVRPAVGDQHVCKVRCTGTAQLDSAALIGGAAVIQSAARHVDRSKTLDQAGGIVASAALNAAAREVAAAFAGRRGVDNVQDSTCTNLEQFAVVLRLFERSDNGVAVQIKI